MKFIDGWGQVFVFTDITSFLAPFLINLPDAELLKSGLPKLRLVGGHKKLSLKEEIEVVSQERKK